MDIQNSETENRGMIRVESRDAARMLVDLFHIQRAPREGFQETDEPECTVESVRWWTEISRFFSNDALKLVYDVASKDARNLHPLCGMIADELLAREENAWVLEHVVTHADEAGRKLFVGSSDTIHLALIIACAFDPDLVALARRPFFDRLIIRGCYVEEIQRLLSHPCTIKRRDVIARVLLLRPLPHDVLVCIFLCAERESIRDAAWNRIAAWWRATASVPMLGDLEIAKALLRRWQVAFPAYADRIEALRSELGFTER
jgi:hypothetical protein